jgi:hypothetical protein
MPATSEDGTAADPLQVAPDSAGRAPGAPAGAKSEGPPPPRTVREFERALQGLGFTRRQAASIARDGFKAAGQPDHAEPEPEPDDRAALDTLRDALKRNLAHLNMKA